MLRSLLMIAAAVTPLGAQDSLPFSDGRWELRGDSTAVETFEGRGSLGIISGTAARRDVRLQDGTIDLDVMMTRRRSFVYVQFRMQDDREYEEFYLRPHKSSLPDALQYAPVRQGQSAWQLFHGSGGTAAIEIEPNVWTRLRIVLSGRRAALFLGDTTTPVLLVNRLAHEPRPGYVALRGFLPAGTPGRGPIARFANVRVRPNLVPFTFPALPADSAPPAGIVREWTVSDAFAAPDTALTSILPAWTTRGTRVPAEANGLVELHRWVKMPAGTSAVGTVARLRITSRTAGLRRFDLGFSDVATVFLNGRPIFRGDDSYSFPSRRDGLISLDQATLYLPLRAGRNDLAVIVTDRFGGWGVMGRFADTAGIRVEPGSH